jgi:polyisoprenyl-teichoic acid--peptidoglycan teichoic acid transferase
MPPRIKRKIVLLKQFITPGVSLIAGLVGLFIAIKILVLGVSWLGERGLTLNYFNVLMRDNPTSLLKTYKGRANILLLGVAGENYSGSDLTDTMIFVSIDLDNADAFVVSLPRDIWSPTLQDKINSAYHYGEGKKSGGGFVLSKSITEEVLGQPIHYAVLIDFAGFKEIIDTLGGVEIIVQESFVDKQFPIPGKENDECDGDPDYACRFETIRFEKGKQIMDGDRALKYVRSRNAEGDQGSDFARSQRQQQVILALKNKATNLGLLANPLKLNKLYEQFTKSVVSDAKLSEALALAKVGTIFSETTIDSVVLDSGDEEEDREGWLYNPPISKFGRWVLYPRNDSFSLIHDLVDCHVSSADCAMEPEDY